MLYVVQTSDFLIKFVNVCQHLRVVFSNIWSFPTKARVKNPCLRWGGEDGDHPWGYPIDRVIINGGWQRRPAA